MSLLRSLSGGLRSLFRRERVKQELDEELNGFLEMAAEEKMKQGMSPKEALRAVRLERGSPEITKEVVRSDSRLGYRREHGHFQRAERHNPSPPPVQEP